MLDTYYRRDVKKFAKQFGYPINNRDSWNEYLVSRALHIGKNLFLGAAIIEEAFDGSVLVALNDGNVLALTCLPEKKLHAQATRVGQTYFVTVNRGVIQSLFSLAITIWRNQDFLSYLGHDVRDETRLNTDFIPPGFEEICLNEEFEFFSTIIHTTFYKCFEKAISFFWLHEVAHVLCGHLDLDIYSESGQSLGIIQEFLNVAELDDETICNIPYQALEIEADRWALYRLFGSVHKRIISRNMLEYSGDIELLSTAIGCTLFPLLLHGDKFLRNRQNYDLAEKHPPLWFRADEVIRAENWAAEQQIFKYNIDKKSGEFEMTRLRQKNLMLRGFVALSKFHPMFGDWLGPITETSRQPEAQYILDKATIDIAPWRDNLSKYRRDIRIRVTDS